MKLLRDHCANGLKHRIGAESAALMAYDTSALTGWSHYLVLISRFFYIAVALDMNAVTVLAEGREGVWNGYRTRRATR